MQTRKSPAPPRPAPPPSADARGQLVPARRTLANLARLTAHANLILDYRQPRGADERRGGFDLRRACDQARESSLALEAALSNANDLLATQALVLQLVAEARAKMATAETAAEAALAALTQAMPSQTEDHALFDRPELAA